MKWDAMRHKLIQVDDTYQLILYLPKEQEVEFGLDFDISKIYEEYTPEKLRKYVTQLYPHIRIQSVKIMAGTLVIGTIFLSTYGMQATYGNTTTVQTTQMIKIRMGDYWLQTDVAPMMQNHRVLVPMRFIAEALGATASWHEKEQMAVFKKGTKEIRLWPNANHAMVNGVRHELDSPSRLISGRIMVPIRMVSEALDTPVEWDSVNQTVLVRSHRAITTHYTVQRGETLSGIAKKFAVTTQDLMRWNNLKNDQIAAAQFLRVAPPFIVSTQTSINQAPLKPYTFDTVLTYTVRYSAGDMSSYNALTKYHRKITDISTFSHRVLSDGRLQTDFSHQGILKQAKDQGVRSTMLIHNTDANGFSTALGNAVLANQEIRKKLIDNIYGEIKKHGYNGVEMDLEELGASSRENYNSFLKELRDKLKPEGYMIAVAVPAKTSDVYKRAYDFQTIGMYADRVLIMSYDQHWTTGAPGPVASIDWVEQVAAYAAKTIPPSKVVLGIAAYGYDWPLYGGAGKAVTNSNISGYLQRYGGQIEWNEAAKVPMYRYKDDKQQERIVWFENAQSTQYKMEVAKKIWVSGNWNLEIGAGEWGVLAGNRRQRKKYIII